MPDGPKGEELPPQEMFWSTYLKDAEEEDKYLPKSWEANTGSVLTFTGLFAATVAAFIIESYKTLSPDSGDQTVALLTQLLAVTANGSMSIDRTHLVATETFRAHPTAIVVNVLWFSSLLIALVCALLSTLIQEWSRDYVRDTNRRRTLDESVRNRAFNHIYIRMGVERYGMDSVVYCVTALVHLAVFLFVIGLAIFLFPIDDVVAAATTGVLGFFLLLYISASVSPLADPSSPYRTPATYLFAGCYFLFLATWHAIVSYGAWLGLKSMQSLAHNAVPSLQELMSRVVTDPDNFMSPGPRFTFAWTRTSRHMLQGQFGRLLRDFQSILEDIRGPDAPWIATTEIFHERSFLMPLECVDTDVTFMKTMHTYIKFTPDHEIIEPALFKVVTLLSWSIFATTQNRSPSSGPQVRTTTAKYMDAIYWMAVIMEGKNRNAIDKLRACLCLAMVKRAFVSRCNAASRKTRLPPLAESVIADIVTPTLPNGLRVSWPHFYLLDVQALDPRIFLLILQFQVYNARYSNVLEYPDAPYWLYSNASCHLVPLHEGDCCKSWRSILTAEGWAHDTASSLLSLIMQYVDTPKEVRMESRSTRSLLGYAFLYFWDCHDLIQDHLSLGPPSAEFIALLEKVGLEEWLKPGSYHTSSPNMYVRGLDPSDDILDEIDALDCLKSLAQFIDWELYHGTQPSRAPQLTTVPCGCHNVSQRSDVGSFHTGPTQSQHDSQNSWIELAPVLLPTGPSSNALDLEVQPFIDASPLEGIIIDTDGEYGGDIAPLELDSPL